MVSGSSTGNYWLLCVAKPQATCKVPMQCIIVYYELATDAGLIEGV